eukprot:g15113.t1
MRPSGARPTNNGSGSSRSDRRRSRSAPPSQRLPRQPTPSQTDIQPRKKAKGACTKGGRRAWRQNRANRDPAVDEDGNVLSFDAHLEGLEHFGVSGLNFRAIAQSVNAIRAAWNNNPSANGTFYTFSGDKGLSSQARLPPGGTRAALGRDGLRVILDAIDGARGSLVTSRFMPGDGKRFQTSHADGRYGVDEEVWNGQREPTAEEQRLIDKKQKDSSAAADTSEKWKSHAVEELNDAEPATCSNCQKPGELSWFFYGGGKRRVVVLDHMVGGESGGVRCSKFPKNPRGVFKPIKKVKTITKKVKTITKEVKTITKKVKTITKEVKTITKKVKTITKEGIRQAVKREARKVPNHASRVKLFRRVEGVALSAVGTDGSPVVIAGVDVDERMEGDGFTPLFLAAYYRRIFAVLFLLKHGASVSVRTAIGQTPLHAAATHAGRRGAAEVVDHLLRLGADENVIDMNSQTPADVIGSGIEGEDSGAEGVERVRKLLANAPGERACRRRGFLVLCDAHYPSGRVELCHGNSHAHNTGIAKRTNSRARQLRAEAEWAGVASMLMGVGADPISLMGDGADNIFEAIVGYM